MNLTHTSHWTHPRDLRTLERRAHFRDAALGIGLGILAALAIVVGMAGLAFGDTWLCTKPEGCWALRNEGQGSKRQLIGHGKMVGSAGGWIVSPADGWQRVDFNEALAGLLPGAAGHSR